jgi:hypothetical protein
MQNMDAYHCVETGETKVKLATQPPGVERTDSVSDGKALGRSCGLEGLADIRRSHSLFQYTWRHINQRLSYCKAENGIFTYNVFWSTPQPIPAVASPSCDLLLVVTGSGSGLSP